MGDSESSQQMIRQRLEAVLNASNSTMAEAHLRVVEEILAQTMDAERYDAAIATLENNGVPCPRMKRARELIASRRD